MCLNCERVWKDYVEDKYLKAEQWVEEQQKSSPFHNTKEQLMPRGGHPNFYKILDEMAILHDKKNSDYSKGLPQGPLGNFIRVSEIKKLYPGFDWATPFGTCIDYMLKQFDAMMILRATKNTSQTGEPVAARLRDVEIYAVIAEIIESEEQK